MAIPCGRYTQQVLEGHGLLTEDRHKSNSYKYHQQKLGADITQLPPTGTANSPPSPVPLPQVLLPLPLPNGLQGLISPQVLTKA